MKELALMVIGWVHTISAVIWLGGIFFVLYVLMPSAKKALGAQAGGIMGEASGRFSAIANTCIILLVITGVLAGLLGHGAGYPGGVLVLKYMLASVMIGVHLYRGYVLGPKIARSQTEGKAALQKLSLGLVKLNLVLGAAIIFLGAASDMK